ncbi:NmrA-like family domain-containing protein 1 [Escovopsis weberi]|uniref:NmrA-like family domain-containing protein 1 n=1 Tax=Escovopsis weberi TaxID=150374 RepID=A0A0M9VWD4_ESCWE|nr:NmrA-like family domain-containing protein 1 [Escovopsis weberi]
MAKVLAVFGATGLQGGSVVRAVLADPELSREFKIRAVTRDATKPAAKALAALGVDVVEADMATAQQAAPAVEGAHTVFIVTDYWQTRSRAIEVAHGKAAADAARAARVAHIVFSSLIDVAAVTRGRLAHVAHFDAKAEIERHVRASGVPASFFHAGSYMTTVVRMLWRRDARGVYEFAIPADPATAQLALFDVADTGKFVKAAIKSFPALVGKHILGASGYYTADAAAAEFAEATGLPARAVRVPDQHFLSAWPDPQTALGILENFQLMEQEGIFAGEDLARSLALVEDRPTSWAEWVAHHKESFVRGDMI